MSIFVPAIVNVLRTAAKHREAEQKAARRHEAERMEAKRRSEERAARWRRDAAVRAARHRAEQSGSIESLGKIMGRGEKA